MSLAKDLLLQARHLSDLDATRPKQANLRRAVSSAYYALFHLLVSDSVGRLISEQPKGLAARVTRAYQHGDMKKVCFHFRDNAEPIRMLLPSGISAELRELSEVFVHLQEARHSADYDVGAIFSRDTVSALLDDAEQAFANWHRVRNRDEGVVFLTALAFAARWTK